MLRGCRASLRLQRVGVLVVARDAVFARDDVGGFDHRHEEIGLMAQEPLFGEKFNVRRILHEADRLGTACDHRGCAVDDDAMRGRRDRL